MRIDKDNIKIVLILLVVALGIGYSYLNTELNINGTANINSANWSVYWNNVQVKNGSVEATTPTIDTGKTTVNFNVTLAEPGDYYEFSVDAVNAGTLDAMIDTISSKLNGTTITTLPTYLEYDVTYSDGTSLEANQELLHDSTETYKVRLAYKDNISASDLPSTNQSLSLQFSVTYKQADENKIQVPHSDYVYTINKYDNNYPNGNKIQFNQSIPSNIVQYASAEEAFSAANSVVCLKHRIQDGKVTESYVVFMVTPEMLQDYPTMTSGAYEIKGVNVYDDNMNCKAEYYDSSSETCLSPYYESNKQVLQTAFGSEQCTEDEYSYNCFGSELSVDSSREGLIELYSDNYFCSAGDKEGAYCLSELE